MYAIKMKVKVKVLCLHKFGILFKRQHYILTSISFLDIPWHLRFPALASLLVSYFTVNMFLQQKSWLKEKLPQLIAPPFMAWKIRV